MNFMKSKFLRNFVAFFLEISAIGISGFGIFVAIVYSNQKNFSYWSFLVGLLVIAYLLKLFAKRLWVIKVCPNCLENRALICKKIDTGNTRVVDIIKESDGYYKIFEDEHEIIEECKYGCGFQNSEYVTEERKEKVG